MPEYYLRKDRTWTEPPTTGGGISDGDKGDITVSSTGTIWTIDSGVVTDSKLAGSISNSKLTTNPLDRANHTGTQTESTITNLTTDLAAKEPSLPSKTGNSLKYLRVNTGETGFEYATVQGGSGTDEVVLITTADKTIPADSCIIVSDYYDIGSGFALDILSGGNLTIV